LQARTNPNPVVKPNSPNPNQTNPNPNPEFFVTLAFVRLYVYPENIF